MTGEKHNDPSSEEMKIVVAFYLVSLVFCVSSLNVPAQNATWQWQLQKKIDLTYDVDVYDIDLFETPAQTITALHALNRFVICYMSAGSFENWRPDIDSFPDSVLGDPLDGWEGERWLDVRNLTALLPIMGARMDIALEKGCDAIEPDNIDGYQTYPEGAPPKTGFNITYEDQIRYNTALAELAHERNMSIALKNDVEQVNDLLNVFDFAITEECWQYEECDTLLPFVSAGKAVFQCEYKRRFNPCEDALPGFSAIRKNLNLKAQPLVMCPPVERVPGCTNELVCNPPQDDDVVLAPCHDDPSRYCVV